MIKKFAAVLTAFIILAALCSCSSNQPGVKLIDKKITLKTGQSRELKLAVNPTPAEIDLVWTSSNENVAVVAKGVVTAKSEGSTTVTAALPSGDSDTCEITVEGAKSASEPQDKTPDSEAKTSKPETKSVETKSAETQPAETQPKTAKTYDVEAEVKQIREWYYATQENPGTHTPNSEILRYTKNGKTTKFSAPMSYNGWDRERWYFYHDGKLYFAFVFKGTDEQRLYFRDDVLIRYIDNSGTTYDYPKASCEIEDRVKNEAYTLLNSDLP